MGGRGSLGGRWEGSSDQRDGTKWVGEIGRVGDGVWGGRGRIVSFSLGAVSKSRRVVVCFPFSRTCRRVSSVSPRCALEETPSVDSCLLQKRVKRADSRPEPRQPVRTSPESASSAHAYRSAPPPWADPGSSPNSPCPLPSLSCPHGHLSASAPLRRQAFIKENTAAFHSLLSSKCLLLRSVETWVRTDHHLCVTCLTANDFTKKNISIPINQ